MKILTGKFKRRNISVPKNRNKVRMTTGIVKESVINIFKNFISGALILDVFAGSGSIGLEFLSNDAKKVIFIEASSYNIDIIKKNLSTLNIEENMYELIHSDFQYGLKRISKRAGFNFIYLDPPYNKNLLVPALEIISENIDDLLAEDAVVIAEHHIKGRLNNKIGNLEKFDHRKYGTVILDFYRKSVITK